MKYRKLLSLLDTYEPKTARDRWSRDQARDFAQTHVNVLHRANLQGHFTASAFVVDRRSWRGAPLVRQSRFLLIWHKKLDKWIQPGGHADGDEDLLAVAAREVEEETGLAPEPVDGRLFDLDIHSIPPSPKVPAHLHYDVRFLFVGDPEAPLAPKGDECHEAAWMSREEARERGIVLEPSVLRMVDKALGP